jgi:hypothetical protein
MNDFGTKEWVVLTVLFIGLVFLGLSSRSGGDAEYSGVSHVQHP